MGNSRAIVHGGRGCSCGLQEGGIDIAFEKSMLPLFWEGLIVTATYQRLRDGPNTRWILSQLGYVWPSWYCEAGCMEEHKQKAEP